MTIVARDDAIQIDRLELGPFGTNSYVLTCKQTLESVVVDAPGEVVKVLEALNQSHPQYLLITHHHLDHVGGLSELKSALNLPVAVHGADAGGMSASTEILLKDGDEISFGAVQLKVLHTPGHTRGSICFLTGNYLISGDTLFPGGPGKTRSPDDFRLIMESISQKIFQLPDDTQVFPGHGESTSLRKERRAFESFSARPRDLKLYGDIVWVQ